MSVAKPFPGISMYRFLDRVHTHTEESLEDMPILCFTIQRNKYINYLEFFLMDGNFFNNLEDITTNLPLFYPNNQPKVIIHGIYQSQCQLSNHSLECPLSNHSLECHQQIKVVEIIPDISEDRQVRLHSRVSWVLSTEILQTLSVFSTPISKNVHLFFYENPEASRLYSSNGLLPSPIIVYESSSNQKEAYILQTYGKYKPNGEFYTFSAQSWESLNANPNLYSITRFALLMKSPLFFIDCFTKEEIDADADSILIYHTPPIPNEYWVKHYTQQIPLSYHGAP
jgi:hypothetical protein